ncbi:MAG: hypothetical protein ACR2GL_07105 [Thermoleophilaceae bacterium]
MTNYLLAYRGGGRPDTEAEREAVMAAWGAWFTDLGEAVVDPGNPFAASLTLSASGTTAEEGASGLTGYSVIAADSLAAARELAMGCPVLAGDATVEVYETFPAM